jgi:cytochrome o ubiquinol oxidase subunit 2
MFNHSGLIAGEESLLMLHAVELMLIVVIPVYCLIFFFAWWYRASNKKAKYVPNWSHAKMDELIWWAIPFEIVLVLGALTWTSTHQLDPRASLDTQTPPLVIEVVALDWKWLFIYPEQKIATVNYLRIPVGRPVRFDVTADAPMNSFWIPGLGGQIYAMTGMVNELNLEATAAGVYPGRSANYSGIGFAKMKFAAEATPENEFNTWVEKIKNTSPTLGSVEYVSLRAPSTIDTPVMFNLRDQDLYDTIVDSFGGSHGSIMHMH